MFTGPSRSIFALAAAVIASSALSACCSAAASAESSYGRSEAGWPPARRRRRRVLRLVGADDRARPASTLPSRSSSVDFGEHLVERRLHRVDAGLRQVREVAFGGRARDVELGDHGANRLERGARVLDRRLVLVGLDAQRRRPPRRRPARPARSASSARTSASSCASPVGDRRAQSSTRRRVCSSSAAERAGALLELGAPLLRGAALRRRAPRRARPAPRARRRLRRRGGSARRPPRGPRTGAAARRSAARRPAAARRSSRAIDARASSCRRRARRAPLRPDGARARAARAFCASRVVFVGGALQLRVVADDRLLLPVLLGVQRGDRARRLGDRGLERRGLLGEAGQRLALGARCARAAP